MIAFLSTHNVKNYVNESPPLWLFSSEFATIKAVVSGVKLILYYIYIEEYRRNNKTNIYFLTL